MEPDEIEDLFRRSDGRFAFARWGRPVAPVVFGVDDATLSVVKGAVEAVAALAGQEVAETDPELGSNLMFFFFRDWAELTEVDGMDRLLPELPGLVARLQAADANQYRLFRFDDQGAIQACFVFLRMDDALAEVPAQDLALSQVVQSFLLWSDRAFQKASPLALVEGRTILRPDIGGLIRAAYDPVLPPVAEDASHALRLSARMQVAARQAEAASEEGS